MHNQHFGTIWSKSNEFDKFDFKVDLESLKSESQRLQTVNYMKASTLWPGPALGRCKQLYWAGPPKLWGPKYIFFYINNALKKLIYMNSIK